MVANFEFELEIAEVSVTLHLSICSVCTFAPTEHELKRCILIKLLTKSLSVLMSTNKIIKTKIIFDQSKMKGIDVTDLIYITYSITVFWF